MEWAHQSRDCWGSAISAAAGRMPEESGSGHRKIFIHAVEPAIGTVKIVRRRPIERKIPFQPPGTSEQTRHERCLRIWAIISRKPRRHLIYPDEML